MLWFSKKKVEKDLEKILAGKQQTKKYLGILDSYGVSWSLEKAARDTLQNFFDGNHQTLDGVDISVTNVGFRKHQVRIQNHSTYDFRRLLHLGGTTKAEDTHSAGGIGEGAKILALALLRDYGFSQVRFGSQDWVVDFSMNDIPDGEYVEKRKGLFAKCSKASEPIDGNFVELRTSNKRNAQVFEEAKDLFYHSQNPDFQNPTLEIPKVGGFRFLGQNRNGNFYFAGQRRHLDEEVWENVENVSIWAWSNRGLRKDRDRGLVTKKEFYEGIVKPMVQSTKRDELERVLYEMEPIWTEVSGYEKKVGPGILEAIADRLGVQGVKLTFDDKYVASCLGGWSYRDALREQGYIICNSNLSKVGMLTVAERFRRLQEHQKLEPTEKDTQKIEVLYDSVRPLGREPKEVWVFGKDQEKNIVNGEYNERFVWMARESLRTSYHQALATYLHELDHKHGTDQSKEFSYALTDTLGEVIMQMTRQPETFQALEKRWKGI